MLKGLCWNLMICLVTVVCMIHGDYFTQKDKEYTSFSWKRDQRGCCFPHEIKTNLKHKTFKLLLYFWCNVFGEVPQKYIIISCAMSLFWYKSQTFSWLSFVTWLKQGKLITDISLKAFMIKQKQISWEISSFIKILFTFYYFLPAIYFLLAAPNEKRRWSVPCTLPMVLSVVSWCCDFFKFFITETKELSSFLSAWYMTTFSLVIFAWLMIWE